MLASIGSFLVLPRWRKDENRHRNVFVKIKILFPNLLLVQWITRCRELLSHSKKSVYVFASFRFELRSIETQKSSTEHTLRNFTTLYDYVTHTRTWNYPIWEQRGHSPNRKRAIGSDHFNHFLCAAMQFFAFSSEKISPKLAPTNDLVFSLFFPARVNPPILSRFSHLRTRINWYQWWRDHSRLCHSTLEPPKTKSNLPFFVNSIHFSRVNESVS